MIIRWLRKSFGVDLTWLNVKKNVAFTIVVFTVVWALDLELNPFARLHIHNRFLFTNGMFKNKAKEWWRKLVLKSFRFDVQFLTGAMQMLREEYKNRTCVLMFSQMPAFFQCINICNSRSSWPWRDFFLFNRSQRSFL